MDGISGVLYLSSSDLDSADDAYAEDYYYDDVELIYDLDAPVPMLPMLSTGSDWSATSSQIEPVTLDTIHQDIQLLVFVILMIYTVTFVLFITRKWR